MITADQRAPVYVHDLVRQINAEFLSARSITGTFSGPVAATTLSASGAVTGAGFDALFASPPPIGTATPDAGNFTTVGATTRGTIAGTTGNFNSTLAVTGLSTLTGGFSAGANSTVTGTLGVSSTINANGGINNTSGDLSINQTGTTLRLGGDGKVVSLFGTSTTLALNAYYASAWKFASTGYAGWMDINNSDGSIEFQTAGTGSAGAALTNVVQVKFAHTSATVNHLILSGGATGNAATIQSSGEANAPLALSGNGIGRIQLYGGNFGAIIAQFIPVASATQHVTFANTNGAGGIVDTSAGTLTLKSAGTTAITATAALITNALKTSFSLPAVTPSYTVATLPAAATYQYGYAFVTDATLTTITGLGLAPTGGGANKVPVYSDGTNWLML